jgi:hypothetical protein
MDLGKLLAAQFTAKNDEERTAKAEREKSLVSKRDAKERNFEALQAVFEPILVSFNTTVGSGAWLKLETRPPELRFDHGFNRVLLIKVGEAHVEISRGGAQGRHTRPFSKPFFFMAYTDADEPIFSESYHIDSAWITADDFAALCLREALQVE